MSLHRVYRVVLLLVLTMTAACDEWPGTGPTCDPNVTVGLPHSCPIPGNDPGSSQGKCRQSYETGGACDEGLTCIDKACIPCGRDGESCCMGGVNEPDTCDPGNACQPGPDEWKWCTDSCGSPGKECCEQDYNHCPAVAGSYCNDDNQCQLLDDPCNSGTTPHTVYIVDQGCLQTTEPFLFFADTEAAIQECTALYLSTYGNPGQTLSPVDGEGVCEDWCKTTSLLGTEPWQLCYLVAEGPGACQSFFCGNDDCTWSDDGEACAF